MTIIANLNPSPDWFIGVNSFDITDGDTLIETGVAGLRALDAGVSGGDTYEAADTVENSAISIITGPPISTGNFTESLGEISFVRVE